MLWTGMFKEIYLRKTVHNLYSIQKQQEKVHEWRITTTLSYMINNTQEAH